MKKRHSTVLQNAWSKKDKHSHWKNNSGFQKHYKFIWKNGKAPSYKMPETKKQTLSLKKQFWL